LLPGSVFQKCDENMKSYEKYYTESLYPFQDGVLKLVDELKTPFYLTGGTALSRHYFNHRYSDDLDFFCNQNPAHVEGVQAIFERLVEVSQRGQFSIDFNRVIRSRDFTQIYLHQADVVLKLDIVNDVAPHFGAWETNPVLGRVDGWQNILTNKITALGRLEVKDFVDLWMIAMHHEFHWRTAFVEAKQKDAGLDVMMIYELLRSVPPDSLNLVKWVKRIDTDRLMQDFTRMADDLFYGRINSLCRYKATLKP
jgi:hypothetical protein